MLRTEVAGNIHTTLERSARGCVQIEQYDTFLCKKINYTKYIFSFPNSYRLLIMTRVVCCKGERQSWLIF